MHINIFLKIALVMGVLYSITGCQPPASGEAAGMQSPILYMQLMQSTLTPPLDVPVEGVSNKQLQDTWGGARSNGRKHEGIDIFAKRGTAVLSTTAGIVSRVGVNNLGGKVVWITGPELSRHYYAHLDAYAPNIAAGDWVESGQVIGYVGNTGNAQTTPPHLHYGIYLNNQGAVNPYPYLRPINISNTQTNRDNVNSADANSPSTNGSDTNGNDAKKQTES